MTATLIPETPVDVGDDLTRAREVVATARSDGHTALIAHNALLTIETLAQQVEAAQATIHTERNEWAEWVQFAVERSQEVASDEDWCGVYDDTMERLGLPRRSPQETDIDWWLDVEVTVDIDEDVLREHVRENVITGDYETVSIPDTAYANVIVRVSGSYTAPEGDCVCSSVDDDDIDNNLPAWVSGFDWERGTLYCDNCN